jgi:hypothetical protein
MIIYDLNAQLTSTSPSCTAYSGPGGTLNTLALGGEGGSPGLEALMGLQGMSYER